MATSDAEFKDLYKLLGVERDADDVTIKKAYKKEALRVHPDKYQGTEDPAKLFHELQQAMNVLSDEEARKAYDQQLRAREIAEERKRAENAQSRALREALEKREMEFKQKRTEQKTKSHAEAIKLQNEALIRDLMKQGKIKRPPAEKAPPPAPSQTQAQDQSTNARTIVVKWTKSEVQHTKDSLQRLFSAYGNIEAVALRNGRALISFDSELGASLALNHERIQSGPPSTRVTVRLLGAQDSSDLDGVEPLEAQPAPIPPAAPEHVFTRSAASLDDFEAQTLLMLQRAAAAKGQSQPPSASAAAAPAGPSPASPPQRARSPPPAAHAAPIDLTDELNARDSHANGKRKAVSSDSSHSAQPELSASPPEKRAKAKAAPAEVDPAPADDNPNTAAASQPSKPFQFDDTDTEMLDSKAPAPTAPSAPRPARVDLTGPSEDAELDSEDASAALAAARRRMNARKKDQTDKRKFRMKVSVGAVEADES